MSWALFGSTTEIRSWITSRLKKEGEKSYKKPKKSFYKAYNLNLQPGTQLSIETSGRGRVKLRTSCFFMVTISNLGNLQQKNMADVCLDSDLT